MSDSHSEPAGVGSAADTTATTGPKASPARRPVDFEFRGSGGEFFKIWIVNLCLTILTLGIYSAWAKVRTNQYFYGHTSLNNSSFEYTATPMQILKGRLIAFAVFTAYNVVTQIYPLAALPLMLLFAGALPWIITRSLIFSHYNTRYRNIRFGFNGGYRDALMAFVVLPAVAILSLGILFPMVACRQQSWLVNNARFGNTEFKAKLSVGEFYSIYVSGLFLLGSTLIIFTLAHMFVPHLAPLVPLVMLPFYYLVFIYISVKVTNLTLNSSSLGSHHFESRLQTLPYVGILLTNTLAIILTLGFATPWAMIRTARYRAGCTTALVAGDLNQFVQAQQETQNAFGEELGEVFDLEFGV